MTQEQYNRAVEISKRLKELEEVKYEMEHYHSLALVDGDRTKILPYVNSFISDILNRHDKQIREDIDSEIKELKKKIEEL